MSFFELRESFCFFETRVNIKFRFCNIYFQYVIYLAIQFFITHYIIAIDNIIYYINFVWYHLIVNLTINKLQFVNQFEFCIKKYEFWIVFVVVIRVTYLFLIVFFRFVAKIFLSNNNEHLFVKDFWQFFANILLSKLARCRCLLKFFEFSKFFYNFFFSSRWRFYSTFLRYLKKSLLSFSFSKFFVKQITITFTKLSQSIQSIINAIIIFNFLSTKNQIQKRNIKISSIELIEFFAQWVVDRFVFKIVIQRFYVVIVEYKITSNYLKFLSTNFRIEKISFFKNTFVEKQSQIRLSLDESRAFNHFFITNSKFVSIAFANNNNFFDDNNFFDFNSINTREIFVEKIIYDESIKFYSNFVVMIVNINFFVQTTIIVAIQIVMTQIFTQLTQ